MEPIITVALIVGTLHKVIESAAGEAGQRAWDMLSNLIHRYRPDSGPRTEDREGYSLVDLPQNDTEIDALANNLIHLVSTDSNFAADLRSWLQIMNPAESSTSNTISGAVHGNAVQARDIGGSITFG